MANNETRAPDAELIVDTAEGPVLAGSRCMQCHALFFPARVACEQCGARMMSAELLPGHGHLWSWTTQSFPPPSPPYFRLEDKSQFKPFSLGYVDLGEVLVLSRLQPRAGGALRVGDRMQMEVMTLPDLAGNTSERIPLFVTAESDARTCGTEA
jgi:uncharacterized OB-fold protein